MYRVELKARRRVSTRPLVSLFLMYRVELKGVFNVIHDDILRWFLMYRVELKVLLPCSAKSKEESS